MEPINQTNSKLDGQRVSKIACLLVSVFVQVAYVVVPAVYYQLRGIEFLCTRGLLYASITRCSFEEYVKGDLLQLVIVNVFTLGLPTILLFFLVWLFWGRVWPGIKLRSGT